MKNAALFLVVVCTAIALVLFAVPALAQASGGGAGAAAISVSELAKHAGPIAALIMSVVAFLKSPLAGLVWGRMPPAARVVVLAGLGALAASLEAIAMGKPIAEAILIGLTALFGAIAVREMFRAVVPGKAMKPPISAVR